MRAWNSQVQIPSADRMIPRKSRCTTQLPCFVFYNSTNSDSRKWLTNSAQSVLYYTLLMTAVEQVRQKGKIPSRQYPAVRVGLRAVWLICLEHLHFRQNVLQFSGLLKRAKRDNLEHLQLQPFEHRNWWCPESIINIFVRVKSNSSEKIRKKSTFVMD